MTDFAAVAAHLATSGHKTTPAHARKTSEPPRTTAIVARPRPIATSTPNQPKATPSNAGSKAALLAHASRANAPSRTSPPNPIPPRTSSAQHKALLAATKSFEAQKVTEHKPLVAPLSAKEAMLTQKKLEARQLESTERRKGPIIKIAPEMLTQHPPIRMEREEKQHNDRLHASAVTLAKQTYARQQSNPHHSLQNTATKLANEKLAKLQEANGDSALRDYYGFAPVRRSKSHHLIQSTKSRLGANTESDDIAQSRRIRSQMSLLQAQIADVDSNKRDQDRQKLMEAAKKKVHNDMHKLDETVFKETGKMSPALLEEWDAKARTRLREKRAAAESKPDDAVYVGGGRLLHRADIDELAESRVKPTLAGIDEAVAKRHAEEESARLQEAERKKEAQAEKQRKREEKAERKRVHAEEKTERKRIHDEEKAERRRSHEIEKRGREDARTSEEPHGEQATIRRVRASTDDHSSRHEHHRFSGTWKRFSHRSPDKQPISIEGPKQNDESDQTYDHQANDLQPTPPKRQSFWKRISVARSSSPDPKDDNEPSKPMSRFKGFTKAKRRHNEHVPIDTGAERHNTRHSIISVTSTFSKPRQSSSDTNSDGSSPSRRVGGFRGAVNKLIRRSDTSNSVEDERPIGKSFEPLNRPIISAPVEGSLEINRSTPPVSVLRLDQAGTGSISSVEDDTRPQDKRKDKLAGAHKDSKFHEEIT